MRGMMDINQIRHRNVRALVRRLEDDAGKVGARAGGLAMLAEKMGKSSAQVNHFAAESAIKNIGDKIAREIETAFDLEYGWMDCANPASESPPRMHSQSLQLDADTLSETARTLRERLGDAGMVCALIEHQPHLFMRAYELYASDTRDERTPEQERALAMKLADLTPQGAEKDERGKTVPIEGAAGQGMGTRGKHKT